MALDFLLFFFSLLPQALTRVNRCEPFPPTVCSHARSPGPRTLPCMHAGELGVCPADVGVRRCVVRTVVCIYMYKRPARYHNFRICTLHRRRDGCPSCSDSRGSLGFHGRPKPGSNMKEGDKYLGVKCCHMSGCCVEWSIDIHVLILSAPHGRRRFRRVAPSWQIFVNQCLLLLMDMPLRLRLSFWRAKCSRITSW